MIQLYESDSFLPHSTLKSQGHRQTRWEIKRTQLASDYVTSPHTDKTVHSERCTRGSRYFRPPILRKTREQSRQDREGWELNPVASPQLCGMRILCSCEYELESISTEVLLTSNFSRTLFNIHSNQVVSPEVGNFVKSTNEAAETLGQVLLLHAKEVVQSDSISMSVQQNRDFDGPVDAAYTKRPLFGDFVISL